MKALVLGVIATLALTRTPAHADRDYKIAVVATDVGSMGIIALSAGLANGLEKAKVVAVGMVVGIGGFALGAPIAHAIEGNYGRMGLSIATRLTLPTIGMAAGTRLDLGGGGSFLTSGPVVGFLVGAALTTVVDVALAWTADEPTSETPRLISFGGRF